MWEEPGTVRATRRRQVEQVFRDAGLQVDQETIEQGLLAISGKQHDAWISGGMFHPDDGARHFIDGLGHDLTPEIEDLISEALLLTADGPELNLAEGIEPTLRTLKENGYRLAIVCDVGLAPSPVLRGCLDSAGLLGYFDGWAFSDEVGVYKPDRQIFAHALDSIGARPEDSWHVGDLKRTDVAGSRDFGMTPVRYRGVAEDEDEASEAEHVITSHPEILDLLD